MIHQLHCPSAMKLVASNALAALALALLLYVPFVQADRADQCQTVYEYAPIIPFNDRANFDSWCTDGQSGRTFIRRLSSTGLTLNLPHRRLPYCLCGLFRALWSSLFFLKRWGLWL
jgi:hypothetical protein